MLLPDIFDLFQLSESSNFEVESSRARIHYPACCSLQIHLSLSLPVVPAPLARAGSSKPTIHIAINRGINMATTYLLLLSRRAMCLAAHWQNQLMECKELNSCSREMLVRLCSVWPPPSTPWGYIYMVRTCRWATWIILEYLHVALSWSSLAPHGICICT